MKKNALKIGVLIGTVLVFSQCSKVTDTGKDLIAALIDGIVSNSLGWKGEEEDLSNLENDINLKSDTDLSADVDLTDKLPPIGDQGQYGTCVAWSVGYNLRTFMHAVDYDLSKSDLELKQNQYSPKDLFLAINNDDKGKDCNGTNFEYALDVLVDRGITTQDIAPYTELSNCSQLPDADWTEDAATQKIDNYRKINHTDVNTIKNYLDANRVISFGAKLGDKFMQTEDDEVLRSPETYGYTGQHAYHAMLLSGYDDSKQAFRVVNSWGTQWGDKGYIWVDYDFFVDEFCFCAFVAQSSRKGDDFEPDADGDGDVDEDKVEEGQDLVAWELFDELDEDYVDDQDRERYIDYNVYNVGDQTISKSSRWSILYLIYNAYDANEYEILLMDYYSDEFTTPHEDDCDGDWCPENYGDLDYQEYQTAFPEGLPGLAGNYWNNVDVPAGRSISAEGDEDPGFRFYYTMPNNISGKYYMVLIADGWDNIKETVEDNNFLYITAANGEPLEVKDGIIESNISQRLKSQKTPQKNAASPNPTAKTEENLNTYSPEEIKQMIKHHKETGEFADKLKSYQARKSQKSKRRL